mgnify:CR=1 FL=1
MANDNPFNGFNPFQSMFQVNPSQLAPTAAMEQMVRGMTRWQIETQSLMSRRAQAYLEIPGRLAQCRTPQELMQEQTHFWQTAFQQYSEASRRILGAWSLSMQMPSAGMETQKGQKPPQQQRDYVSFSDPVQPKEQPNGMSAGFRRRVA